MFCFLQSIPSGDNEIRTRDLLLARQALSQLSYTPRYVMGLNGLEPSTSRLSGVRSNQLSYKPIFSFCKSGSHLLSHTVSSIVPSAGQVLTFVFGMCTGVPPVRIATRNFQLFYSNLLFCPTTISIPLRFISIDSVVQYLLAYTHSGMQAYPFVYAHRCRSR